MARIVKRQTKFDSADEFINHCKMVESQRSAFRDYISDLRKDFLVYLTDVHGKEVSIFAGGVVQIFIDFLVWRTDVERIEDITASIIHRNFLGFWDKKVVSPSTKNEDVLQILDDFFTFIKDNKCIQIKHVTGANNSGILHGEHS